MKHFSFGYSPTGSVEIELALGGMPYSNDASF